MFINNVFFDSIEPDAVVGGCINIYENIWKNHKETIEEVENECNNFSSGLNWRRATVNEGEVNIGRTNYDLGITYHAKTDNNLIAQKIHNQYHFLLTSTIIPYASKQGIDNLYHEYYVMLRYQGGQEYKAHFDGETGSGRAISSILYLNNDYEGGEIEFVNFGIKIKPEPGMFLLFPSNYAYRHIAHPVTDGTKYAIVSWTHDRPI